MKTNLSQPKPSAANQTSSDPPQNRTKSPFNPNPSTSIQAVQLPSKRELPRPPEEETKKVRKTATFAEETKENTSPHTQSSKLIAKSSTSASSLVSPNATTKNVSVSPKPSKSVKSEDKPAVSQPKALTTDLNSTEVKTAKTDPSVPKAQKRVLSSEKTKIEQQKQNASAEGANKNRKSRVAALEEKKQTSEIETEKKKEDCLEEGKNESKAGLASSGEKERCRKVEGEKKKRSRSLKCDASNVGELKIECELEGKTVKCFEIGCPRVFEKFADVVRHVKCEHCYKCTASWCVFETDIKGELLKHVETHNVVAMPKKQRNKSREGSKVRTRRVCPSKK